MSGDRRWMRRVAPPTVFCACGLAFLWLGGHDDPGRLALELALSAALGTAVYLLLGQPDQAAERGGRRRPTGAFHSSCAWNQELFDAVPNKLLIVRRDGSLAAINRAARVGFGLPLQRRENQGLRDLLVAADRDVFGALLEQIDCTGRAHMEATGLRGNGSTFDALAQGSRLTYLEEPAMLLNVVDVTEQRLAAEQRASLSRKILVAQEEERARIARDLHDGLGQVIAALHLEVDWTRNRLADTSGVPHGEFAQAASLIEEAGAKLRGICRGLRPPLLDDFGLMPAIRQLVDEVREHTSLEIDLEEKLDEDRLSVPPEGALCVFRVLQEALTNVARHAEAPKVWVTLVREYQWLILSVYDSGRGFDANDPESGGGYGIEGMHERAGLVGGSVKVHSVPDQGTRVVLRVPVPRQPEEEGT